MFLLVLIISAALFLVFGLGYGSVLAERLGVSLHHPVFNNRFNFGPVNVRSQNDHYLTSNTSSHNSLFDVPEGQRTLGLFLDSSEPVLSAESELPCQTLIRDAAVNSKNILGLVLDSVAREEEDKKLHSSGGTTLQPTTAQANFAATMRAESNRETILRALRDTIQQNAAGTSETRLTILENSLTDTKTTTETGDATSEQETFARNLEESTN